MDIERFTKHLTPVSTSEIFSRGDEFNQDGLLSETIFGPLDTDSRKTTFSYINLNTYVIHPSALKIILQLDAKIKKFISRQENFSIDEKGLLTIDPDGFSGMTKFLEIFHKIKFRGDTEIRNKYIKLLEKSFSEKLLFINKIPVIPPFYRDASKDPSGKWAVDPLNDIYQSIIRRADQIKSAVGSGILFDLLAYGLQNAITEHDTYIRTKLEKKSGLIRGNMLGKRVDFSGRAVITPGPELNINEVGLPMRMAVTLFEPFLIHILLYSRRYKREDLEKEFKKHHNFDLSVESIKKVIMDIEKGEKLPPSLYNIFKEVTELVLEKKYVILKRDPVLHPGSIRGFKPKLIEGNTMRLCPLQVGQFGADFDGDTMGVMVPLTNEAQEEIKTKLMRVYEGSNSKGLMAELSKEMFVGLYLVTKDSKEKNSPIAVTDEELAEKNITDPFLIVRHRNNVTTIGRALFNSCLPKDYPYVNTQVNKKIVNKIVGEISKKYDQDEFIRTMSLLYKLGFKFSTIFSPSILLEYLNVPDEIYRLKDKLDKVSTEEAAALLKDMEKILVEHLKGTGLYDLIESGSGKGWGQPMQILVAKGIIADTKGNLLEPIKSSFSDGLTTKEFFNQTYGARQGITKRTLSTADTGYLNRKLVHILNQVELHRTQLDCGTKRHITIKLTEDIISRLSGRYILDDRDRPQLFNLETAKVGQVIRLRSPIFCETKENMICHTCYGKLLERHRSPYIGVLAAQTIGERGTQLIMRAFHVGGAVQVIKRNIIKDIIQNNVFLSQED